MQMNAYQECTKINIEVNTQVFEKYWHVLEYRAPLLSTRDENIPKIIINNCNYFGNFKP